jgi:hypothetical protein
MLFNVILILGSKTVLEEGSIAVTELNCPAVFMVKHLIYIPNVVGSDFISSALTRHFVIPIVSASEQLCYRHFRFKS